ncbi:hypothetical protein [Oscillibacter sp.]|uniref:hypothetical protein n=1 Tax=Oscillibacter sp. TaxID=1945593 RepID=UPI0028A0D11D|nr:hypothetical protein [Oscillibacter sp.]
MQRQVLHTDETTLQVLREEGKKRSPRAICGCTEPAAMPSTPLYKPVLDALLAWSQTKNAPPKSALGKALY